MGCLAHYETGSYQRAAYSMHYETGSYQRAAYSMHTIVASALKMEITYSHFHSTIHSKVHWLHL